jgi:hypothetical protein
MTGVSIPYLLVVLCLVWTSSAIGLVIRVVWHMSKYLILTFLGYLGLGLDKGVCWESYEYQSCSKLLKLACVKNLVTFGLVV